MAIQEAPTTVVAEFSVGGEVGIKVEQIDAVYRLSWSDYVANDWAEEYPTLSIAIARASVLVACAEGGFEEAFVSRPADFALDVSKFFKGQLS